MNNRKLADLHCHLLAALDDGPRTAEDALAMCRISYEDGTRLIAATAHQNEYFPEVNPDRIRTATKALAAALREANIPLEVFPCAEVMARPDIVSAWQRGELLSIGDHRKHLLVEMPHGLFVDLREHIRSLQKAGVQVVLAHPERCPELLHDDELIDDFVKAGCLVQVSTHSITEPRSRVDEQALKRWFERGVVHVLGSDGHSVARRPPLMMQAYLKVAAWVGEVAADRVASSNGLAILQGLPLHINPPEPARKHWISRLWGKN